jgi:hypothetical protein
VADHPNEIIVEVRRGRTKLVPWSDYEIEGPTALIRTKQTRYGLPRVLDYVVRLEQEGELVAERRCEVFGSTGTSDGSSAAVSRRSPSNPAIVSSTARSSHAQGSPRSACIAFG